MTATIIPFTPSNTQPFQFQVTMDGSIYTCVMGWNLFGRRYYLSIYTLQGALVVALPLIGSPAGYDISLTAGYFVTKLVFRQAASQFEVISP